MIASLLAVVTVSYLTARLAKVSNHKEKPLHAYFLPQPQQTLAEDCHAAFEQKIDSLLGTRREQHLETLNGFAPRQISEATKQDNRYLVVTALNAGITIALGAVAPLWLILTVPLSLYLVRRPFQDAWQSLVHERRMTVALVDAIAVSAAILAGFWQVTAIGLFLYAVALKLLNTSKQKSRQQLGGLFMRVSTCVWVQRGGVETEINIADLQEDDVVVVRSGEIIPVDGIILQGIALVDQRILTGESQPAEKQVGDDVFAFTLLLSGRLELKVCKSGQQTVAARIGDILQKTADYKNQHECRAEQIADRAVAPTLLLSVLALPISGMSGAIGVLWSCFGYTMRISSPMSVMNFLRHASEQQILIKDGMALDVLPGIDTVIFDKTGTLTEEQPELHLIHRFAQHTDNDILAFAAAAEHRQSHPIASAIITAAQQQGLSLPLAEHSHCQVGYGIEVCIAGQATHIGSTRFMESVGIALPEMAIHIQTQAESQGHSVVMLAIGGLLAGAIELRPQLRPSAHATVQALKACGIHTCIISGDRETPTRNLAEKLGIDDYFANTLPEQKAQIAQRLQAEGRTVCFIGDGINDAIALKQADISVSLKGATTAATDTAQIIFMDGDLSHLPTLIDMGQQFQKTQHQNMWISVVPAAISISGIMLLHGGLALAAVMFYLGMGLSVRNAIQPIQLSNLKNHDN